jgi:hypothetical protein
MGPALHDPKRTACALPRAELEMLPEAGHLGWFAHEGARLAAAMGGAP